MFKKKLLLISATTILFSSSSIALDVKEALASTYENNKSLKEARQDFLVEIESFPEALGGFLPSISGEISSSKSKQKIKSPLVPNTHSSESDPTGSNRISVSQNVFAGGRSFLALKRAQSSFWISKANLYNKEQETLKKAIDAYLSVTEAREKYNIAIDSLEYSQRNLKMAEEKLKLGEATITEVSLAKSRVSQALANKSRKYAAVLSNNALFKNITNLEATDDMFFPELPQDLPQSLEEFEAKVSKGNLNLLGLSHSLNQAKDATKSSLAALLPTANLQIVAQKDYYKNQSVNTRTLNRIVTQTSMNVSIPIYNKGGADYTNIRKAKKSTRKAVYRLDQAKRDINSKAIAIWENYIASKDSIDFVNNHVDYQKLALDGIRQEYEVGAKTMLDVLETQEKYNKAKEEAVEIKKAYILSAYSLKEFSGSLLAKDLNLKVKYFKPEKEFKRVKYKIFGF